MNIPDVGDPPVSFAAGLFADNSAALRGYAVRRVGDAAADDVVSEVFVVVARGKAPPPGVDVLPWLYSVAYRIVLQHRSRTQRSEKLHRRLRTIPPRPYIEADSPLLAREWVLSLIDRLPDRDAELLRLLVFEELDVPTAAAALGVTAGAAHTRLHRIRRKIASWLGDDDASVQTLRSPR